LVSQQHNLGFQSRLRLEWRDQDVEEQDQEGDHCAISLADLAAHASPDEVLSMDTCTLAEIFRSPQWCLGVGRSPMDQAEICTPVEQSSTPSDAAFLPIAAVYLPFAQEGHFGREVAACNKCENSKPYSERAGNVNGPRASSCAKTTSCPR
jgi:hypothetical protein